MRWKLLIVASLLAAAAGAGLCFAVAYALSAAPRWWPVAAFPAPLGAAAFAAVFVYRHTARRRALQAAATALLSLLLMLTALLAVSLIAGAPAYINEPAPPPTTS